MAGHGGHAAIHAARARKLKAQLDRVREALVQAGVEVDDADPEGVARAVEALADLARDQARRLEDAEWEAAGKRQGR